MKSYFPVLRKLTLLLTMSGALVLHSCEDWLYLEPEDGIIRREFWQTKEDVHSAVMGVYASLLGGGTGYSIPEQLFLWGEIRADMVRPHRIRTDFNYIHQGDILPSNGVVRWNNFYRTINYCNTVLEFMPEVLVRDESFNNEAYLQYEAEMLAIRGLMYFYLVRAFGEVPVKLEATTSDRLQFVIPKSTQQEVISQIKSDLKQAEENAVFSLGDIPNDKGRITRYTVNAIQADVYLWNEQYDSTIIACDKIINSGLFGLVPGNEFWFTTLYVNGNSPEGIFELQFSESRTNPYYDYFYQQRFFIANPAAIEEYFPRDPFAAPDSVDIRGEGASYRTASNYAIWKSVGMEKDVLRTPAESHANWIVYRYAEILLFKAEALTQLDRGEEALPLIQQVRRRAQARRATDIEPGVSDVVTLTDFILAERAREFAYEGKRWFDVLRTAKRNSYQRKDVLINAAIFAAPSDRIVTIRNKYQNVLSHYFPIHVDELLANPALVQNSFYISN